jgi:hypothetical protein
MRKKRTKLTNNEENGRENNQTKRKRIVKKKGIYAKNSCRPKSMSSTFTENPWGAVLATEGFS